MARKKKKRKKKRYFGFLDISESPTLQDLYQEAKQQKRNQDDYWLY